MAFKIPSGLYKFKVLPFVLVNVLAIFQMLMDKILAGQIG